MVSVRRMKEEDLPEAGRIFSVAFGTFLGMPNPEEFGGDRSFVNTRWRANPQAALAADVDGRLAGSNFVTNWGSFGFFGPLTIRPEFWNQGIAQRLLGPTVDLFEKWGVRAAGLYTFSNSPKHVALYQKFGFWPRFLTALMGKVVEPHQDTAVRFSSLAGSERQEAIRGSRELTDSIYEGLDVTSEIQSVRDQKLGDTLLLRGGDRLDGVAVCHCGAGTEAGKDRCYAKFAAARDARAFDHLLDGIEALAADHGVSRITAGINLERCKAYRQLLARGYRADMVGVAMLRPDAPAYNRPDVYAIDDWR